MVRSATQSEDEDVQERTDPVWRRQRHIPELDGLRGLAILLVTLYRFGRSNPSEAWAASVWGDAFAVGERGVDLFFVLSGFLITGILVDTKHRHDFFRHFFIRRGLRIFPLYFAFLLVVLVLVPVALGSYAPFQNAAERQLALWTYLTNVQMAWEGAWCFGALDHFWSLSVEEHFYLFWPFVIYLVSQRTALRLAVGLALLSAASRVVFVLASPNHVAPEVFTLFRCDALLIGSAMSLMIRADNKLQRILRSAYWLAPALAVAAVATAVLHRRVLTIPNTLWPLLWACVMVMLLTTDRQSRIARFFRASWLRKLGKHSYAMYVVQSPLIPVVSLLYVACPDAIASRLIVPANSMLAAWAYVAAMFALTYAIALVTWYVLEQPCLQLKGRFAPDTRLAPASVFSVVDRSPPMRQV